MKITLDIPENLIKEAMKITNTSNKTELIVMVLRDIIQKSRIKKLIDYKGKINVDFDLDIFDDNENACSAKYDA